MEKKLEIKQIMRVEYLSVSTIVYCQAKDNWTKIVQVADSICEVPQTLKKVEQRIDEGYFLRVHRSYMVNLFYIDEILGIYEFLKMHDGYMIPVSRRRRPVLKQSLRKYFTPV